MKGRKYGQSMAMIIFGEVGVTGGNVGGKGDDKEKKLWSFIKLVFKCGGQVVMLVRER